MFIVFETGKTHFNWKPFFFKSRICIRFGWLWFAIAYHPMSYYEWCRKMENGETEWLDKSPRS